MKKPSLDGSSPLHIIMIVVVIGLVAGVGYYAYKVQKSKNEAKYFVNLAETTEALYAEQLNSLGVTVANQDLVKNCHQSGQGPFDDGHLQCDVTVNKKIQIKPDGDYIHNLFEKFEATIKDQKFVIIGGGSEHAGIDGGVIQAGIYNDLSKPCSVNLNYTPQSDYQDAKTTLDYKLTCGGESSKVHKGFIYTPLR